VPKSHEGGDRYRCQGTFDPSGKTYQAGTVRTLPPSTIYGFKGRSRVPGSTPSTASR
jgi:hypothetical protein